MVTLAAIRAQAGENGLTVTGGFHTGPDDGAPEGTRTLLLLGYGGHEMWAAFQAGPEAADGARHPLDRWSTRVIGALAEAFDAKALFPFGGPPYQPFIRWTYAGEPIQQSKLGMSIHPSRGLWSGWRGALAFSEVVETPAQAPAQSLCAPCPAPCRAACPVGAFTDDGYDAAACRAHLNGPAGAPCRTKGCLARRACPVGAEAAQSDAQAAFHLDAFRVA
ncbi:MAG: ferredoxin [Pseudomonadota bacterium]